MKTPYSFDCPNFYGDYYRGRQREECRLMVKTEDATKWTSKLCSNCPVPEILNANACPNMMLNAEVNSIFFSFGTKIRVITSCTKSGKPVSEPHIGCGECHLLPKIFYEELK